MNKTKKHSIVMMFCPHCCKQQPQRSYVSGDETIYTLLDAPPNILKDIKKQRPFVCSKCGRRFTIRMLNKEPYVSMILKGEFNVPSN